MEHIKLLNPHDNSASPAHGQQRHLHLFMNHHTKTLSKIHFTVTGFVCVTLFVLGATILPVTLHLMWGKGPPLSILPRFPWLGLPGRF